MRQFLAAIAGSVALGVLVFAWAELDRASNRPILMKILTSDDFCTQATQSDCKGKKYIVRTPDAPSVGEVLESGALREYVHGDSCLFGQWLLTDLNDHPYAWCRLVADPSAFTDLEKLEDIGRVLRDEKDKPWKSPIADPEVPQVASARKLLRLLQVGAAQSEEEIQALRNSEKGDAPECGSGKVECASK